MLRWLWEYWEASPCRITHQRPAVRPENADWERKAKPHPKSRPERTPPPPQKCEALGSCSDPVTHPILSRNFPAEPALDSSAAQRDPGEHRGPGHTAGPAFFQEDAPATTLRGTRSSPEHLEGHTGRAAQSVPGRLHACASEPTYRHSPRDGRGFLFFLLVARAIPLAQGPLPTLVRPGGGLSALGRPSRPSSCSGSLPFLPPPWWTGESRLRRQAGLTGSSGGGRPASAACALGGVSTALS